MREKRTKSGLRLARFWHIHRVYGLLAPRACSILIFASLFCTMAAKFFHSYRSHIVSRYFGWILADIAVLVALEVALVAVCFRWRRKWVMRTAIAISAVVCTWSVMNAGLLIRRGMQIVPSSLLPIVWEPVSSLKIVGVNILKMPAAAAFLLGPSAVALAFLLCVLTKPKPLDYTRRRFVGKVLVSATVVFVSLLARGAVAGQHSEQVAFAGLAENCQLRAIESLLSSCENVARSNSTENPARRIPAFDELNIEPAPDRQSTPPNIVVLILEGVQHSYTSLADSPDSPHYSGHKKAKTSNNPTPYLAGLARQGVEFTNTRSTLTHSTKALFSLLSGRYPSPAQDIAEAVPVVKPYLALASVLKTRLGFRTAFFESSMGNFECGPGLFHNLGFDSFWARENCDDPNAFLGYMSCDDFTMLKPVTEWIKGDEKPFLLTLMCSVTHDPYEVPQWFTTPAKKPTERYRQTIAYTDRFIEALDGELHNLNLADKTIFCIISDHGEAFGEHGLFAHARIAFDEALRVPWVIRAPGLIEPGTRVTEPVSSVDLTPTLLSLAGFNIGTGDFDGVNALGDIPDDRRVYFSGWMQEGPAGFVKGSHKFVYHPISKKVFIYDLSRDPDELVRIDPPEQQGQEIAAGIMAWKRENVFQVSQQRTGKLTLFDSWFCHWNNRVASAKYHPPTSN
ncbi:MAG: LTA synthase family protein [Planctomycetota bacterium]|jgi:hypothetical protein